ncbi:MAG TPA: iron transporter [Bacteroidetes bacterium]|nr:iron transporter [Bacteroidota bacterium]
MKKIFILSLYLLPIPVLLGSFFIGSAFHISLIDLWQYYSGSPSILSESAQIVLFDIRAPRIILVFLVGAVLSASGGAMQAVFRNPLVDPFILGLSSGAAFGAALSVSFHLLPLIPSAFIFGILAAGTSYFAAMQNKEVSTISLILAGVVVNGIFTALLTIIQFISDPFKLQSIIHWTMGNFHTASWEKVQVSLLPMVVGLCILLLYRWRLNVLALGDDEAKSSGVHVLRDKWILLLIISIACSAAVAVAGIIGFYGLIVPHIVRMIVGVDNRKLIPLCIALGGSFLVVIDDISRSLMSFELPIGIFTMIIGAPVFLFLMKKNHIGWNH